MRTWFMAQLGPEVSNAKPRSQTCRLSPAPDPGQADPGQTAPRRAGVPRGGNRYRRRVHHQRDQALSRQGAQQAQNPSETRARGSRRHRRVGRGRPGDRGGVRPTCRQSREHLFTGWPADEANCLLHKAGDLIRDAHHRLLSLACTTGLPDQRSCKRSVRATTSAHAHAAVSPQRFVPRPPPPGRTTSRRRWVGTRSAPAPRVPAARARRRPTRAAAGSGTRRR
jgi:hypothetical protein